MNVNDVIGVMLPRQPRLNLVTLVMKNGSIQVLRGADATQFLVDWTSYQEKRHTIQPRNVLSD
jgi:hypothetical protein